MEFNWKVAFSSLILQMEGQVRFIRLEKIHFEILFLDKYYIYYWRWTFPNTRRKKINKSVQNLTPEIIDNNSPTTISS
jgi:hypothetical protein